jgi:hypothetical protein
MIYRGTRAIPLASPEWRECRVRNQAHQRVIIADADAAKVAPYDLFVNKAGTVVAQDLMGRRVPLATLCAFTLEKRLTV